MLHLKRPNWKKTAHIVCYFLFLAFQDQQISSHCTSTRNLGALIKRLNGKEMVHKICHWFSLYFLGSSVRISSISSRFILARNFEALIKRLSCKEMAHKKVGYMSFPPRNYQSGLLFRSSSDNYSFLSRVFYGALFQQLALSSGEIRDPPVPTVHCTEKPRSMNFMEFRKTHNGWFLLLSYYENIWSGKIIIIWFYRRSADFLWLLSLRLPEL